MKNSKSTTGFKKIFFIYAVILATLMSIQNSYSQRWSGLSTGMNDWVHALTVYNGDLIVGGQFTSAGGVPANYIARWNGSSWSPLGTGTNAEVDALTVFNGELVAGGRFTFAGGVELNFIAKWDGTSWNDELGGVGSSVTSLTVYQNRLIVGGYFIEADGSPAGYIASRGSGGWLNMGGGMNSQVMTLGHYGSDLVAGGFFTTAGGSPASHIAKWNGTSWSPVGTGIGHIVYSLAEYNGELIAGGLFTSAGGVSANNIAKWNGSNWSPLGSGMGGVFYHYVFGLSVLNNELYAGGLFETAGGITTNGIAVWDGSSWSSLGTGLFYGGSNAYGAYAVNTYGNSIIVGGLFNSVDAINVYHIAQWTPAITGTLNITAIQEGFYDPAVNKLNQSDIIEAELRESVTPFNIVETMSSVLDSETLTGSFQIISAPSGSYYLVLKHRNSIETWSSAALDYVGGSTISYDFSESAINAFGNNMIHVDSSPVRYAIYSGDVNQDGIVDESDLLEVYNDATIFLTGYVNSDLTGNNVTDVSDLIIDFNNSNNFISKIVP